MINLDDWAEIRHLFSTGKHSKREILERYLNTVYLGNGAYGVRAGAEELFSKPIAELTLPLLLAAPGIVIIFTS